MVGLVHTVVLLVLQTGFQQMTNILLNQNEKH